MRQEPEPGVAKSLRMMRRLFAVTVAVAMLLGFAATPIARAADCPNGMLGTVPLSAADKASLGAIDARYCVIVPPGFDGSRTYPILFLLHGVGDTFRVWSNNTDVAVLVDELHASGLDVVVVMPDGGGTSAQATTAPGWYSDWADGSRKWETFHIDHLVPHAVASYHGDPSRLMVAGLSMGGYGAMKYAARHPGTFAAAASFSGAVDTMYGYPAIAVAFKALHSTFGTPDERVWGPATDVESWREHNPSDPDNVRRLGGTPLWLATGNGVPIGRHDECRDAAGESARCASLASKPTSLGSYGLEHFIAHMNVSFASRLTAFGVEPTTWLYEGGSHSWPYWQDALRWSLPQMLENIG